ncbi:MAG: hypothetical protein HYY01_12955 [Chloroflexi bacterium]|nr:hypothetical protein [Chloroflexota bacterium]
MTNSIKAALTGGLVGGVVVGVFLLIAGAGAPLVQARPSNQAPPTHQQMHQMMDAVHGEGTSQQMHDAMGPDAETLMDQCVTMMGMMNSMQSKMGGMSQQAGQGGLPMGGMMQGMMGH